MLPSNKCSAHIHSVHVHIAKPVQAYSDIANMSKANNTKVQQFHNDIVTPFNSHA